MSNIEKIEQALTQALEAIKELRPEPKIADFGNLVVEPEAEVQGTEKSDSVRYADLPGWPSTFPERLSFLIEHKGLTVQLFARIIGVQAGTVSGWTSSLEHCRKFPVQRNIDKICELFEITEKELFL